MPRLQPYAKYSLTS